MPILSIPLPFSAWLKTRDGHNITCAVFDNRQWTIDPEHESTSTRFPFYLEMAACLDTFTDKEREALDMFARDFCTKHSEGHRFVGIKGHPGPTREDHINAALDLSRRIPRIPLEFSVAAVQVMGRWDRSHAHAYPDNPRLWAEWIYEAQHEIAENGVRGDGRGNIWHRVQKRLDAASEKQEAAE